jgi:hypothetical protein
VLIVIDRICSLLKTYVIEAGASVVMGMVGDRLPGLTPYSEKSTPRNSAVLGEEKKTASELYFVECKTQSIYIVGGAECFGTRDVTLIYLAFTNGDILLALPGRGVTLEGGYKWSCEVGVGDAVLVATSAREGGTN